jgi:hypothetical protein
MKCLWIVWCAYCNCGATVAPPPNSVDFQKVVNCVLCNRPIDAGRGAFNYYKEVVKKPEVDYLTVS